MRDSNKIKNPLPSKVKKALINEFYKEGHDKADEILSYSDEITEFKSKLVSTSNKMNVLNDDVFDFDFDTLSIIEQGEYIRGNRKAKTEFILFVLVSFIILTLYSLAIIKIGPKLLIISQIIIVMIIPWIGMTAMVIKRNGSEI
jgi:hypothetical protein